MEDKLQERVDYYEFLIDFVSHEIRNPLTAMIMFTRLMKDGAYGESAPRQREVLDSILANANRIEHMIADFLNLNLVEGGRTRLRLEELELAGDIIDPAISDLKRKNLFTPERKADFRCRSRKGVRVLADRRLMNVVIDNLLFNAVKYGRPGTAISYGWKAGKERVAVWVRNEGQGVRKRDLGIIFDKFVRLKDPKIPPKQGTGLGLYNVRRIVEMHGGGIRAESEYGSSFTVRFTIPLAPGKALVSPRARRRST